jgi:uncharacterized phage protein gp47/JayE
MPVPVKSVYIPVPTAMGLMIAQMQSEGSPITDFSEGSGTRSIMEAFSVVISSQSQVADQLQLDSFLETATEDALDAQGSNWQVKRLPAVQASGTITITRQATVGPLVIPAGWGQLTVPPSVPGAEGIAILTLEDAKFAEGAATATVAAQAVLGGTSGNLTAGTVLTPISPVGGVSSAEGFKVAVTFTGGVNVESDEAYRARIPKVVQGRVKGRKVSFEAAALSVPGVLSVGVLKAGTIRSNGSEVLPGHVEVVYQGAASLLGAVTSACEEAATLNQNVTVLAGISLEAPRGQQRAVAEMTIFYAPGINAATLKAEVAKIAREFVEKVGVGHTLYMSELIEAIHKLPEVVSIGIPLTKLALFGEAGATNLVMGPDQYPILAEGDLTITMTELK